MQQGKLAEAEEAFRQELATLRRLEKDGEQTPRDRQGLVQIYYYLGGIAAARGRPA